VFTQAVAAAALGFGHGGRCGHIVFDHGGQHTGGSGHGTDGGCTCEEAAAGHAGGLIAHGFLLNLVTEQKYLGTVLHTPNVTSLWLFVDQG
jgi:hypothetical protein